MGNLNMLKEAQELLKEFIGYAEKMHLSSEAVSTLIVNASKKLVLDALDKILVHILEWGILFYIVFLIYKIISAFLARRMGCRK